MPRIEFEDERVVNLGTSPYLTVETKEKEEEESKKVATVKLYQGEKCIDSVRRRTSYLQNIAALYSDRSIRVKQVLTSVDDTLDSEDSSSGKQQAVAKNTAIIIPSF